MIHDGFSTSRLACRRVIECENNGWMGKALYGILVVEWLAPHEPYLSIGNYLDDPQKGSTII